jgi:N-acetylmuramoyl-L-alanine amidase CwlA
MKITKQLSKYNHNPASRGKGDIKYIVLHWVGAVSTAKNNAVYFGGGNRNASAHYFVDEKSVYQVVADKDIAWHCGGGLQDQGSTLKKYGAKLYNKATNGNSIGIEMCLDKKNHISGKTYQNAAELIESLQAKYGIDDAHVVRHFDVTGKLCPGTLTKDSDWAEWKSKYLAAGKPTPKPPTKPAAKPYRVKILVDTLNVRQKPELESKVVTKVRKGAVYTITDSKKEKATAITWLKLKSGVGWIASQYAEKA